MTFLMLLSCNLPTEQISYQKKPVVFGYIDAGFNQIEPIYLYWSDNFSNSHSDGVDYISDATISISTNGNDPEYICNEADDSCLDENELKITFTQNSDKEYIASMPENLQITTGSKWILDIEFEDGGEIYRLNSSTEIPEAITLTSAISDKLWTCNGENININAFNLNLDENNNIENLEEKVHDFLNSGAEDYSLILDQNIQVDNITYDTRECYTSSFASVPFFTIDIGSEDENIIARYTTIALEPNKDMNLDGINIPYEAAIFDTTLSANAFKGPMNYNNSYNYSQHSEITSIPYEWGWYREPIDRINLTANIIDIMWLFIDYYGINMMMIQPMGDDYEKYYEGDPDEFSFPYILRQTNIESNQGDAYGLFYSTNSEFFFFNVLKENE